MDKVHKKRAALARSFMRLSQPYINKTKMPDKVRLKVVPLSVIANNHLPRQRVQILTPQPIQKNTRPQGGFFYG